MTSTGVPAARVQPSAWAVFTKPWRDVSASQLGEKVAGMGFDAVEFPLRPGYQVDLDDVEASLGALVSALAGHGVSVVSVATDPGERALAACAAHKIDLARIMVPIDADGFAATRDAVRRELDALVPLALKHGVRIGIQPHVDFYITDSADLAPLLDEYDPAAVVAVWDAAHDGLAGQRPRHALELLWARLGMVNFKNAALRPSPRRTDGAVEWDITFVEGAEGLCSWPEAAHYLRDHGYAGPVCLPAEYTDERDVEGKAAADLRYLQSLMGAS